MAGYNLSEPKAILAESLSEIIALASQVKEIRADILEAQKITQEGLRLAQEDIDQLGRALGDFTRNLATFRANIVIEVNQAAAEAFDEQLKKVEGMFAQLPREASAKKSWWKWW